MNTQDEGQPTQDPTDPRTFTDRLAELARREQQIDHRMEADMGIGGMPPTTTVERNIMEQIAEDVHRARTRFEDEFPGAQAAAPRPMTATEVEHMMQEMERIRERRRARAEDPQFRWPPATPVDMAGAPLAEPLRADNMAAPLTATEAETIWRNRGPRVIGENKPPGRFHRWVKNHIQVYPDADRLGFGIIFNHKEGGTARVHIHFLFFLISLTLYRPRP